jgi:hypothetical protein
MEENSAQMGVYWKLCKIEIPGTRRNALIIPNTCSHFVSACPHFAGASTLNLNILSAHVRLECGGYMLRKCLCATVGTVLQYQTLAIRRFVNDITSALSARLPLDSSASVRELKYLSY